MECPKCDGGLLKPTVVKSKQIEIDRCQTCKGLWFDDKELINILGAKVEKNLSVPDFALLNSKIKCPKCLQGLYEFCYPGTVTLVDVCKNCHGVWLDNNEWKEIKSARNAQKQISCPRCSAKQPKSDSCINCGVVFAKLNSRKTKKLDEDDVLIVRNRRSYAENIPGTKGRLLRFIDHSINKLTRY